jgi:hypothetical protein
MRLERVAAKAVRAPQVVHTRRRRLPSGPHALGTQVQRVTVRIQLVDVEDLEAVSFENLGRCQQREVREVLVVSRIKLGALDEAKDVRDLDRRRRVRCYDGVWWPECERAGWYPCGRASTPPRLLQCVGS